MRGETTVDKRAHPRFQTRFDALCSSGSEEGAGTLSDLSYQGARVEDASIRPAIGTKIRLYVFIQPVSPFELHGYVVRHTDEGFAIEFANIEPEIARLVDDVAAIVS
jgi:hypothetical protein